MLNTTRISSALLIASALLWSCSDVEDLANVSNPVETEAAEGMAFVKFRLQSNQSSSTRSVEDSHTYVQGTADEYKVNTARVYLYDAPTKLFVKTFLLSNITRKGSDSTITPCLRTVLYRDFRLSTDAPCRRITSTVESSGFWQ